MTYCLPSLYAHHPTTLNVPYLIYQQGWVAWVYTSLLSMQRASIIPTHCPAPYVILNQDKEYAYATIKKQLENKVQKQTPGWSHSHLQSMLQWTAWVTQKCNGPTQTKKGPLLSYPSLNMGSHCTELPFMMPLPYSMDGHQPTWPPCVSVVNPLMSNMHSHVQEEAFQ